MPAVCLPNIYLFPASMALHLRCFPSASLLSAAHPKNETPNYPSKPLDTRGNCTGRRHGKCGDGAEARDGEKGSRTKLARQVGTGKQTVRRVRMDHAACEQKSPKRRWKTPKKRRPSLEAGIQSCTRSSCGKLWLLANRSELDRNKAVQSFRRCRDFCITAWF